MTAVSEYPPAYLITFHTYGSWLHGEVQGSVDREHNRPESEFAPADVKRVAAMQRRMIGNSFVLQKIERTIATQTCHEVCEHRNWELLAINVRTNHIHTVVAAEEEADRIMNSFKSWITRKLREAHLIDLGTRVWSRHGSTRYLWNDPSIESACRYVVEGQGIDLS